MLPRLLCAILISLTLTIHVQADENNLPALPKTLIIDEQIEISFWQKIKNFFGFGEKNNEEASEIAKENLPSKEITDPYQEPVLLSEGDDIAEQAISMKQEQDGGGTNNQDEVEQLLNNFSKIIEEENSSDVPIISSQTEENKTEDNIVSSKKIEKTDNKEIEDSNLLSKVENISEDILSQADHQEITIAESANIAGENKVNAQMEELQGEETQREETQREETKAETIESMTRNNNVDLPTPTYAEEADKTAIIIDNIAEVFQKNKNSEEKLPIIEQKDYKSASVEKQIAPDPKQIEFVNNEVQVLVLPNDDIVLGKLTAEAELEQMSLYYYIKKFWQNYGQLKAENKAKRIDYFIDNYQDNFKSRS